MNLRKIQTELARNLEGYGYVVYSDALLAAASIQLPAVVVGIPDQIELVNKMRTNVSLPVHVLLSTANSGDALDKLSQSINFRGDGESILGAIMRATSPYWQAVDVESITGFALINVGASQSALACDINIVISTVQVP